MDVHICVGALLVRQGDEPRLLLALRSPARRSFPGVWDMPGGHCELGETLETTLVRELQEEIGVTPTAWRHVRDLHEMLPDGNDALKLHVYAVTAWTGTPYNRLPDEHATVAWFTLAEACKLSPLGHLDYPQVFRSIIADS